MPPFYPEGKVKDLCQATSVSLCSALILSASQLLCGCSSRIATNQANMAKLEQKNELMVGGGGNPHVAAENQVGSANQTQEDMALLQTVSEGLLHAWRTACADKDDKAAMAELKEMQKKYPQILQVEFMMGQVEDHFGKREEAIVHFRKAANGSEFSSMHLFKLADALRRSGKYKEAESYFRKLYTGAPDIVPYQYMLGDCLCAQNKDSKEGRQLIESALKAAPNDEIAKGIAKARL